MEESVMLPNRYRQLLTAYIDGELSDRRAAAVQRLLNKSPRARILLRRLERDSRRLRALPKPPPAPDLAPRVLHVIAEKGLRPGPGRGRVGSPAAVPGFPSWVGLAIAAAVLLAVTASSYFCFAHLRGRAARSAAVAEGNQPEPAGFRVALRELERAGQRSRLAAELHKDTAYHLSLTCRDSRKAVEGLQRAFRSRGITLVVDAQAGTGQEPRGGYLLYAEDLLPEELTAILQQLGASGSRAEAVVVNAMTGEQRQSVARLLGVAPEKLAPAKAAVPSPALSEMIIEGRQAGQAAAAAPERFAVVLAANASGGPGSEIRDRLRLRQPQRPGTLQVIFVFDQASA
jgi:hypothetical protein